MNSPVRHVPVLFAEVMNWLALKPTGIYIDCTLGGGGHASGILEGSRPAGRLLALDRDSDAIAVATRHLQPYQDRLTTVHRSFADVGDVARAQGLTQVDGIVLDLGLSLLQLSDAGRGFSFQADGPLDMRFDQSQTWSALDVVNHWSERDIADLIAQYGEEPRARAIARAIVRRRPLATTAALAAVVASVAGRRGRRHPATRTFQALRMAVNDELDALRAALPQAVELLGSSGRLLVISFHSLEDRIVKEFYRQQQQIGALSILTKKPITPADDEIRVNPRSRSAKLRVATRASAL
ncbi:MAG: 16S rRNA (cytosine(1402)-N(4))-methyltransferase RsmH [Chloroflexi bacterium]|nr:16S rRNA (cytosine(1402)-N(4))-methyltransferase RsmH [Chloroflexota bacterium]